MKNTPQLTALAKEYLNFKNLDDTTIDTMDYIQQYERLTDKLEQAGISFYDLSVFATSLQFT